MLGMVVCGGLWGHSSRLGTSGAPPAAANSRGRLSLLKTMMVSGPRNPSTCRDQQGCKPETRGLRACQLIDWVLAERAVTHGVFTVLPGQGQGSLDCWIESSQVDCKEA